jgi:serine/threonine protein kinase
VVSQFGSDALIQVLGVTGTGSLVMEYLDNFRSLAGPPSLETCSRDVYADSTALSWEEASAIVLKLLDALVNLHHVGIMHGDLYGHNILVQANNLTNIRLSDFGAAFFFDREQDYAKLLQTIELRAFAIFVDEIAALLYDKNDEKKLKQLAAACRRSGATFEAVHMG